MASFTGKEAEMLNQLIKVQPQTFTNLQFMHKLVLTWQTQSIRKCKFLQNSFILLDLVTQDKVAPLEFCVSSEEGADLLQQQQEVWRHK